MTWSTPHYTLNFSTVFSPNNFRLVCFLYHNLNPFSNYAYLINFFSNFCRWRAICIIMGFSPLIYGHGTSLAPTLPIHHSQLFFVDEIHRFVGGILPKILSRSHIFKARISLQKSLLQNCRASRMIIFFYLLNYTLVQGKESYTLWNELHLYWVGKSIQFLRRVRCAQ